MSTIPWSTDPDERVGQVQAAAFGTDDPAATLAALTDAIYPADELDRDDLPQVGDVVVAKADAQNQLEASTGTPSETRWARTVVILAAVLRSPPP